MSERNPKQPSDLRDNGDEKEFIRLPDGLELGAVNSEKTGKDRKSGAKTEIINVKSHPLLGANSQQPDELEAASEKIIEEIRSSTCRAEAVKPSKSELWKKHRESISAVLLSLVAFGLYLFTFDRPLTQTPEARTAVVAREMLENREFVVPTAGGEIRLQKPPLPYWAAAGAAIFSSWFAPQLLSDEQPVLVDERAVRLPSAIAGALCVFILLLFGSAVFGYASGVWSALIMGFSTLPLFMFSTGGGEGLFTLFTTCAYCSAAWLVCRPKPSGGSAVLLGLSLGAALLCKAHVAFLVFLPIIAEALYQRKVNKTKILFFGAALLFSAAVVLPWIFLLADRLPEGFSVWSVYKGEAHLSIAPIGHDQNDRVVYYFYKMAFSLLPWLPLILIAAWTARRKKLRAAKDCGCFFWPTAGMPTAEIRPRITAQPTVEMRAFSRFFAWAFCLGFLALYALPKQQDYYLLPLIAPAALWFGNMIAKLRQPGGKVEEFLAWTQLLGGTWLGLVIAGAPWWLESAAAIAGWTEHASVLEARNMLTPGVCVPLGLATVILSFIGARQWVNSRPAGAGLCLWAPVCVCAALIVLYRANEDFRAVDLPNRALMDRTYLLTSAKDFEFEFGAAWDWQDRQYGLYGANGAPAMFTYYYRRPVLPLYALATEDDAKQALRVLICKKSMARNLQIEESLWRIIHPRPWRDLKKAATDKDDFILAVLPPDRDWPALARKFARKATSEED